MLTQLRLRPFCFMLIGMLLCFGITSSVVMSKAYSFQYFNQYHNDWLNRFFIGYTFMGDGLISILAVIALLLFKKYKEALLLLVAFLSSGLLSCLLKNLFSLPRPKLYFEQTHLLYGQFIEGVTLSNNSSFPSGHTTSAFAMATVVVLLSNNKLFSFMSITAALLVAYSRMYLGQHFLQDVTAGAVLGIVCAMGSYYCIYQKQVTIKWWKKNKYSMNQEISPQWN